MIPYKHKQAIKESKTLVHLLNHRAACQGDKTAYILLDEKGNESDRICYAELVKSARNIASTIQRKVSKGDRCLILLPPGLQFITGFLGCLFAGVIAIPSYPPRRKKTNERFWSVFHNAEPLCILTSPEIKESLNGHFDFSERLQDIPHVVIEGEYADDSTYWENPDVEPDDIAMLQYTSGSTGQPMGVMVSHDNLMHNFEVVKQSFHHDENLIGVSWLPPYHDMGLMGTLLQPLYVGGMSVIITPNDFLRSPVIWLNSITKYRGITAGCPNFALDFCVERISEEQKMDIDLTSLKVLFCGSEPIRKKTLDNFSNAFKNCGFTTNKFLPCYGLAESTLLVTGIHCSEPPEYLKVDRQNLERTGKIILSQDNTRSSELVGCGYPWLDGKVIIVDPETGCKVQEHETGEIWIISSSVCRGYWNNPEKTRQIFKAYTSDTKEGPFLKTGDLGFINNGHLYITGRIKDLIIICGINYYPQDIENTVENCHPALQKNACTAFSVDMNDQEQLVVVQEVKRTAIRELNENKIFEAIRSAIAYEHEIPIYAVALISPGSSIKTSSGKIQRRACKSAFLQNDLKLIAYWELDINSQTNVFLFEGNKNISVENIQAWLISWLSNKLKISPKSINPDNPILSYGLDSLGAVELEREVNEQFGIAIHIADFLENNIISEIARIGFESIYAET